MSQSLDKHVIQKDFLYYIKEDGRRSERLKYVVLSASQETQQRRKTVEASISVYKNEKEKQSSSSEIKFKVEQFVTTDIWPTESKQSRQGKSKSSDHICLLILLCEPERLVTFEGQEARLKEWKDKLRSNLGYREDWNLRMEPSVQERLGLHPETLKHIVKLCLTDRLLSIVAVSPQALQCLVKWRLDIVRICSVTSDTSLELLIESKVNQHDTFKFTVEHAEKVSAEINSAIKDFGQDQARPSLDKFQKKESAHSINNHYVESKNNKVIVKPPEPCKPPRVFVNTLSPKTRLKPPDFSLDSIGSASTSPTCDCLCNKHPLPVFTSCGPTCARSNRSSDSSGSSSPKSNRSSKENKPLPPEPVTKPTPAPRNPHRNRSCPFCQQLSCDCLVSIRDEEEWKIDYTLRHLSRRAYPQPDTLSLLSTQRACLDAQLSQKVKSLTVWQILGEHIGLNFEDCQHIEQYVFNNSSLQAGEIVLYHWQFLFNRKQCRLPCKQEALKEILDEVCPSISSEVFNQEGNR